MPLFPGHLHVIAVGKLQAKHWRAAQEAYQKRLQRYTDFRLVEVKDAVGKGFPDAAAMQKEGELLLQAASGAARLILLTPEGQQTTSPGLARFIEKQLQEYGRIAFLIGGPLGFSDDVIAASHFQLALSPLTFPHELARVLLLEQLYRAFTIRNNEKYHK
ncbi:MAG: 23S rRNA (pseudouridine(1915)-N(3))-methyltransferase RlmH [Ardenticatenaceae bacterium]|nr:23S rRNA (pseudouridine(1915)-N(3))-methyltransferase RlmH [Anaerolineales bacterium]MCB8923263.1 23S rRNA (pseudouridine(1915)-N(3))-methyltransferase RlmH [Ardenticatenaceae bacterium]